MHLHGAVANVLALRWPHRHTIEYLWKDGRAAECGGLENRFTGTPGNRGFKSLSFRQSFQPVLRRSLGLFRAGFYLITFDAVR